MRNRPRAVRSSSQSGSTHAYITSAVGMQETVGSLRAKRHTLFTQTVIWVTSVVCMAFLLGSLAQAWSNSQLAQQLQQAQQQLNQLQDHQKHLQQLVDYYKDPTVIEQEAREQLNYVRPNEHAVIFTSSSSPGQQHTPGRPSTSRQADFWQEWWNAFFGG